MCPDERRHYRKMTYTFLFSMYAFVFGGSTQRAIPGGPFLSVTGDLLPMAFAVLAVVLGLTLCRGKDAGTRIAVSLMLLVATVAFARTFNDVYLYWNSPYARGDFWSF